MQQNWEGSRLKIELCLQTVIRDIPRPPIAGTGMRLFEWGIWKVSKAYQECGQVMTLQFSDSRSVMQIDVVGSSTQ
jgi:hypothetical protein